ncbi:non-structural maintenance of chromosomes element 3 homolog [Exaiptasia diaphana]|uniref:MAGE domain-containing protein n=1 Tax=Exaiptasia diaphana TaxID=2652724 RepID=A0A913X147_EXADI|nr:non-structural maintenance of chromosomes element 3 homolog [Exaiptasia diaphana]KXJ16233.1 Melanoma-associated antigen G1 [Exaiptasia diaphana]
MPKASKKSARRSLDSDEEDAPSQSQSQRKGKGPTKKRAKDNDDSSQASPKTQDKLSGDELERKVSETVRYLLFSDRRKVPIKRADISKNVLKEYPRSFPQVMDLAKKKMQKVFGIIVEEIELTGKAKAYILVDGLECEKKNDLLEWGDESHRMGLLMVILSLIFMSENVISEAQLWHTLKKLGLQQKSEHPVFGDPEKLLSQEFVRQGYIEKKKIVGDETSFEYRWGARAFKETSKMQVLEFVAKIYGTETSVWTAQMREIQQEQEEATQDE